MKIIDKYSISDNEYKPIGIVRFKDKYGNVIAEKHNMVVNSGRELIYVLFRNFFNINNTDSHKEWLTSGALKLRLSYDNTASQTTASLDLNTIFISEFSFQSGEIAYKEFDVSDSSSTNSETTVAMDFDNTNRIITFKAKISDNNIAGDYLKFNQIYLYYTYTGSDNTTQYELFSRVAMDPVFLVNGQEYNIEYSLYF